MLRNRLSTLLDIVKYLRQMARDNGTGQMRTLATRIDSNRPPGLSLAAFVRILKAANAAYTELHEIMLWCAQQQSQGRSEIRIKCDHLLLSIAKWKNDPYAGLNSLSTSNPYCPGAPVMVRPVLPRPVQPGLPVQTADGSWTSVSYPNIVPITDGQDQRLHWTYRDAWDEACADSSFAGALMIRNHHLATS